MSTFGNYAGSSWGIPVWNGLSSAERSGQQLYQDWLRENQLSDTQAKSNALLNPSNSQTVYSPLEQLRESDWSGSSGESHDPGPDQGPAPGAVANGLGAFGSMMGQMAGLNSTLSGAIGSAVSGQASGKGALNGLANFGIATALNAVVPGLGLAVGFFGNPMDSILNTFDLPGMVDFGTPLGQMQAKSTMNALDREATDVAQAAQMAAQRDAFNQEAVDIASVANLNSIADAIASNNLGVDFGGYDAGLSASVDSMGGGYGGTTGQTGESGSGTTGSATGTGEGGGVGDGLGGDGWARGGLVQHHRGYRC